MDGIQEKERANTLVEVSAVASERIERGGRLEQVGERDVVQMRFESLIADVRIGAGDELEDGMLAHGDPESVAEEPHGVNHDEDLGGAREWTDGLEGYSFDNLERGVVRAAACLCCVAGLLHSDDP